MSAADGGDRVVGRTASEEDSEDDIFKSTFSGPMAGGPGGKVKISGGHGGGEDGETGLHHHVGLASAKLKDSHIGEEKKDPVKIVPEEHPQTPRQETQHQPTTVGGNLADNNHRNAAANHLPHPNQQQHQANQSYLSSSPSEDMDEEAEAADRFVEITVSEPTKVGEGISSYMAYRVTTRTNLLGLFKKAEFTVTRRFSDFLGLHEKLAEKHQSKGRVIPPPPEKSLVGTTRVKMSSTSSPAAPESNGHAGSPSFQPDQQQQDQQPHQQPTDRAEFIARRRFALERFINRVASHPVLRRDPATVRFLESGGELPRATSTSALSSASVLRLFGRVGDTVSKITYRVEEADPWYREKVPQIDALESQLRRLYALTESLTQCRHELAVATGAFAQGAAALSSAEEAHSLSKALAHLARAEERVEQTHHRQAEADYFYLFELIKDYVALVGAVKGALAERSRAFQAWEHARHTLVKKREQRSRLEMGGRSEKIPAASDEVQEWERRLEESRAAFHSVSAVVRSEVELFERYRVRDFKAAVVRYLEALLNCQLQMVKHWEDLLPEVRAILY